MSEKLLRVASVGAEPGVVNLLALPLWLKGDLLVKATMTPSEARTLAIKLLQAAESAGES